MPKGVSKTGIVFLLLICVGFLLANNILILVSIIPFTLMAFGYYLKMPDGIRVDKTVSKNRVTVGELLEVSVRVLVESGFGSMEICDIVPRILNWWKELITVQCGKGLSRKKYS